MKRILIVILLSGLLLAAVWATGRAQVAANNQTAEWLSEIGERNGGIASFTSNGPECRWLAEHKVYICPEPLPEILPEVLPIRDAAARRQALAQLGGTGLLLITDSAQRRVMAFDPLSGDLIDPNFIPTDQNHMDLSFQAILSPQGDSILVSSFTQDLIQEYDFFGNYRGVYAPAGGPDPTILDTPRGMAIRENGHLLVSSRFEQDDGKVVEFDSDGNSLGAFIDNGEGGLRSPYDLHFWMNTWLVSGSNSDALHQYSPSGLYITDFITVSNFPQQIQSTANGNILAANFSGRDTGVIEVDPAGNIINIFNPLDNGQRGVYELPNGNILTTSGTGSITMGTVYEIDRNTGEIVDIKISGEITPRYIEFVLSPYRIAMTKTVGLDPAECATTDEITVPGGTQVTYCFTVHNTGNATLTIHDLEDDALGIILDDFPFVLPPEASFFVTHTATISQTTLNTAVWEARDDFGVAVAMDSASVIAIPNSISLAKTVGLDPTGCAQTDELTVAPGTPVFYCYTVLNTGWLTQTTHDLVDDHLGIILDDFAYNLAPGESFFVTQTATMVNTTLNTAVWTAYHYPGVATDSDTAFVDVLPNTISLTKTVGLDTAGCAQTKELDVPAGSEVVYCYTVQNTGVFTFTMHDVMDDPLGTILDDFALTLAPGATFFITQPAIINQTTVNTATWTAESNVGIAEAVDNARVNILPISISLNKTVGTNANVCATTTAITVLAGTTVTYCYKVTNTGSLNLTRHDLEDSELGPLLDNFPHALAPGASFTVLETTTILETVTNQAIWTARAVTGISTTALAEATVNVSLLEEFPKVYMPVMFNGD